MKFADAKNYSRSAGVLVEEFIIGREFVVEGICFNYEYKNLCCGDTDYFDIPDVFSASKREFPSIAPKDVVDQVLETNLKIGRAFGLKQGITHAEYIMEGDNVILLEIAGRGGGVFISSDLIHIQTGLDTEKFLIGIATGTIDHIPEFSWQNKSCCYISFFLPQGTVTKVGGIDQVINLPYTHHNNLDTLFVGKESKKNIDKTSRYFVILEGKNHEELMNRRSEIQNLIKVDVIGEDGTVRDIIWD